MVFMASFYQYLVCAARPYSSFLGLAPAEHTWSFVIKEVMEYYGASINDASDLWCEWGMQGS